VTAGVRRSRDAAADVCPSSLSRVRTTAAGQSTQKRRPGFDQSLAGNRIKGRQSQEDHKRKRR
jgi:hypothetical protein